MVSIIVPVYNSANYLERAIDSLLRQTITDIEIILVNDGSTDGSADICNRYAMLDKRIKVIHQQNSGASIARNNGIKCAEGEYISFIDSDDYVDDNYIKSMYDAIIETQSDLIVTGRTQIKIDGRSEMLVPPTKQMYGYEIREFFINKEYDYLRGGPCCKIYKKSIIQNYRIKFPEGIHYLEDAIFVLEYILHSSKISTLSKSNYYYELHKGSLVFSVHGFENETLGYKTFRDTYLCFKEKFGFSGEESFWFYDSLNFLMHRQINALSKTGITNRLKNINLINWKDYRTFNRQSGIKSGLKNILTFFVPGRLLLAGLHLI